MCLKRFLTWPTVMVSQLHSWCAVIAAKQQVPERRLAKSKASRQVCVWFVHKKAGRKTGLWVGMPIG